MLLVGIADSCGTEVLAKMVVGHQVTLTRRGPDKDADGRLLRYVERDGVDVGKRLIQRGWARASRRAQPAPRHLPPDRRAQPRPLLTAQVTGS